MALWAASQIAVVLVPLLVALFPAAPLGPVQEWLVRRGWPRPLAALALVIGLLALIAGAVAGPAPALAGQVPALVESLSMAAQRLQGLIDQLPGADRFAGLDSLTGQAAGWLFGTDHLAGTLRLASTALTVLSGIALALLTVYFVLYRGDRMTHAGVQLLPARTRADALDLGRRLWRTLGAYFRGQVLVGLVDAVLIGIGLLLLGVPLAVPLAVLVFIGALISGSLAVLVALADGGLGLALATLGVVVAVQFFEGNFIEPVLMARMVRLSAFAVIVAVSIGSTLLGVLGALLAVPVAACLTETVRFLRERADADVPPAAVGEPRRSVEILSTATHNDGRSGPQQSARS